MRRPAEQGVRRRVAIGVDRDGQGGAQAAVFGQHTVGIGTRGRAVVDRQHLERHRVARGDTRDGDVIGKAVFAEPVGRRRDGDHTLRRDLHRGVRGRCGQGVAGVAAQGAHRVGQGLRGRRVLVAHEAHAHGQGVAVAAALAVAHQVGEDVVAVVAGLGLIGEAAAGVERHAALRGVDKQGVAQHVAIDVLRRGQHAVVGQVDSNDDAGVGADGWPVVHRQHVDEDAVVVAAVGAAQAIAEAVGAPVVMRRCVGVGARAVDAGAAMCRRADQAVAHAGARRGHGVGGVGQAGTQHRVFVDADHSICAQRAGRERQRAVAELELLDVDERVEA